MKISVVMPVRLIQYEGCATNLSGKFIRAIKSFLKASATLQYNKLYSSELIIVCDSCRESENIGLNFSNEFCNIKVAYAPRENKYESFTGYPRHLGNIKAKGDIITYLDADDVMLPLRLVAICNSFDESKNHESFWWMGNEMIRMNDGSNALRQTKIEFGAVGTSSIAHRKNVIVSWLGKDGYGHDFKFVSELFKNYGQPIKSENADYLICHVPSLGVDN